MAMAAGCLPRLPSASCSGRWMKGRGLVGWAALWQLWPSAAVLVFLLSFCFQFFILAPVCKLLDHQMTFVNYATCHIIIIALYSTATKSLRSFEKVQTFLEIEKAK